MSTPSSRTDPVGRVHQPGEQLGEGGLARAGLADHGHPAAGLDVLGDVTQHQRAAGVAERDVLERDVHRTARQRLPGRAGVVEVGRGLEDPDHTSPAGDRVLGVGEHLGAHLHRADEQGHQEREADHLAGRDVVGEAEPDADDEYAGVGQAGRDPAEAERERGQPLGLGGGHLVDARSPRRCAAGCAPRSRRCGRSRHRRRARRSPRASRRPSAGPRRTPPRAAAGSSATTGTAAGSRPTPGSSAATSRTASPRSPAAPDRC